MERHSVTYDFKDLTEVKDFLGFMNFNYSKAFRPYKCDDINGLLSMGTMRINGHLESLPGISAHITMDELGNFKIDSYTPKLEAVIDSYILAKETERDAADSRGIMRQQIQQQIRRRTLGRQ